MSAGSGASNLGYGNISPSSNINGRFVNVDNSHSQGTFSSNTIPGLPGLAGAKNNVDAAAGVVPGICLFKGGSKQLKRKIKNITRKYKMTGGTKRRRQLKSKMRSMTKSTSGRSRFASGGSSRSRFASGGSSRSRFASGGSSRSRFASGGLSRSRFASGGRGRKRSNVKSRFSRSSRKLVGGYSQYQNNLPMTPSYSVGGILSASQLGLANPPPIQVLPNCTNCVDNYNHFTGTGFPSRGH